MLTRKSPMTAIIAATITALCVAWLVYYYATAGRSPVGYTWWYDTGTKELYTLRKRRWPPIEAPSGKEAVKAVIYATKDCTDTSDRFIMYVYKYTPEGREIMIDFSSDVALMDEKLGIAQETSENMMLVKTIDEPDWILRKQVDRKELIAAETEKRGGTVIPCRESFAG